MSTLRSTLATTDSPLFFHTSPNGTIFSGPYPIDTQYTLCGFIHGPYLHKHSVYVENSEDCAQTLRHLKDLWASLNTLRFDRSFSDQNRCACRAVHAFNQAMQSRES